jgi:hypothetical protein
MELFIGFFKMFTKIFGFLKIKRLYFTVAGWIFITLILIGGVSIYIFEHFDILVFKTILLIDLKISILYIICLIPIFNDKFKQNLKIISHKSYLYFIIYGGLILWGIVHIATKNIPYFEEIVMNNSINVMMTLYGFLTIIWFAYHIIYSDAIQLLKKQLQVYIFIITFLQLFFINKFSKFEYCISILILTYTFIQYLFEDDSHKKQGNGA